MKLFLKVVPASSRDRIAGWLGDMLKVCVTAPAERGKANAAVERIVADALGVPGNCVSITAGGSSARKVLEISGLNEQEVRERLEGERASRRVAEGAEGERKTGD